jgi:hypothetical protein
MEAIIGMGISKVSQALKNASKTKTENESFQVAESITALNPVTLDRLKEENIYAKLQSSQSQTAPGASSLDRITSILFILFWIILGVISAYLSWSSNTLIEWETPFKVLFALGAFLFPIYYLLMYFIGKLSLIRYIERSGCRPALKTI